VYSIRKKRGVVWKKIDDFEKNVEILRWTANLQTAWGKSPYEQEQKPTGENPQSNAFPPLTETQPLWELWWRNFLKPPSLPTIDQRIG